ncbi:IS1096 element passenger TnpR family protein [Tenacibaculum xiamenense]|uniref:IS1096 element passenger TnpR family protein n=1 Tax=Tenacibaculum xiamenense TaxID=1261553 RepID=UPI00389403DB
MYKVRAILDTEEDVIRTLTINENQSLEDLHFSLAKSFGFDGQEMASFYIADAEWNQGDEIPLFNMAEVGEGVSMATCVLKDTLPNKNDKLIYVYDFFNMWTFYVELVDASNEAIEDSKVILAVGEMPKENENNTFDIQDLSKDLDNDFNDDFDDFNNFQSLDDIDLDKY